MDARLRFWGAAGEVTGSMHLIEVNGHTIAMDCGLYQGRRAVANEKNRALPCDPKRISAVILSHAHVDHCGKLPRLVHEGFAGPIYTTPPTRDLAEIVLADSAHIQEEDAAYWNKKRVRHGDPPIEPLYGQADVDATTRLMQSRPLGEMFEVVPGVRASFHEAGHMLGSAGVYVEVAANGRPPRRITFTGDRGRPGIPILHDPAPLPACDYLICESTYGGRETPRPADMDDEFADVINTTVERGGKLIIPAFAVGRTQVLVYYYHRLVHDGRIRRAVPLIVDSPLAVRTTKVFERHPEVYDREATAFNRTTNNHMFRCTDCEYVRDVEDSKALHRRHEPMIIISASGMCEVGRILHHLKNNIEDPHSTVLIVGFQAAHTLGRRLVEKARQVRIFGDTYTVRARVKTLNGFSAHANASELAAATAPLAPLARRAFLVHGEADQAQALATRMRVQGFADVRIPEPGQSFALD